MLFHERGNLHLRDLDGGRTTQLTRSRPGESVSNGQPMWSPDGKRVAFVQSDHSKIRLRSVLVPGDPSYPRVRQTRFARVGGRVVFWRGLALGQQLFGHMADQPVILGVKTDERARISHQRKDIENGFVVLTNLGVGGENLDRTVPFSDQCLNIFKITIARVGDDHVKGVIDDRTFLGKRGIVPQDLTHLLARVLRGE